MEEKHVLIPGRLKLKHTKRKADSQKEIKKGETAANVEEEPALTEAEAKFLAVKSRFKKRTIEKQTSFQDQTEEFNQRLKSYPMHNDLEGE